MESTAVPSFISSSPQSRMQVVTTSTETTTTKFGTTEQIRKVSAYSHGSNASTTVKVLESALAPQSTTVVRREYEQRPVGGSSIRVVEGGSVALASARSGKGPEYETYQTTTTTTSTSVQPTATAAVTNYSTSAHRDWDASAVRRESNTSSVIRREYGEQRVISVTEHLDESRSHVVSERIVEHEIKVPKKIIREELIERIVVVPEKRVVEEVVEDAHKYREKVIEVAKPTIVEKVIEVPEIEYVEKIVEVPVKEIKEVIVEKVVGQPEVIPREVMKRVPREVRVEVPEVIYRDVPQERIVEVPEIIEEVVTVNKPVKIEQVRRVPKERQVDRINHVGRKLPVPVAVETEYEYRLPQLRPVYSKKSFPVYIPRFIEVPVPAEMLSPEMTRLTEIHLSKLNNIPTSLCELETTAAELMKSNVSQELSTVDVQKAVEKAWHNGTLKMTTTTVA